MTSTKLIALAKERFKQLEHKEYDWRGFYNGFLEGFVKAGHYRNSRRKKLFFVLVGLGLFEALNAFTVHYLRANFELSPFYYPFHSFIHYSVFVTAIYLIIKNKIK